MSKVIPQEFKKKTRNLRTFYFVKKSVTIQSGKGLWNLINIFNCVFINNTYIKVYIYNLKVNQCHDDKKTKNIFPSELMTHCDTKNKSM